MKVILPKKTPYISVIYVKNVKKISDLFITKCKISFYIDPEFFANLNHVFQLNDIDARGRPYEAKYVCVHFIFLESVYWQVH